jgi:hypothetical protein
MVFSYYNRLTAEQKRTYRRSDEIRITLPRGVNGGSLIGALERSLAREDRERIQAICQELLDRLTTSFNVPRANVVVLAVRPNNSEGELHGFYEPIDDGAPARISIWMRTAQKKQVVAFKTFLRTLIHELCHHLDYELFQLPETFHTEGFYKRESSLVYALLGQANRPPSEAPERRVKRPEKSAARLLSELREKSSDQKR